MRDRKKEDVRFVWRPYCRFNRLTLIRMSRGIRKRAVEFNKSLKLVHSFDHLYQIIHGDRPDSSPDKVAARDINAWKESEEQQ